MINVKAIREMQIQTIMTYHYTPTKTSKIKANTDSLGCGVPGMAQALQLEMQSRAARLETVVRRFLFSFSFFWPHHAACGILVLQPGIEPVPAALEGGF